MAQIIKKPGVLIALNLLIVLGIAWLISVYVFPVKVKAEGSGESPPAVAATDPVTYDRIRLLRERLALRNEDLAAMGCTQAQAEGVLGVLKSCYEANRTVLREAEKSERLAKGNLEEAIQRMNMGPRDEGLIASVPQLEQAAASARQQKDQLIASAVPSVSAKLNSQQASIWGAARANVASPMRWRYVPDLSGTQLQALEKRWYKSRGDGQAIVDLENQVLSYAQRSAMGSAALNIAQNMAAALRAQDQTLPVLGTAQP